MRLVVLDEFPAWQIYTLAIVVLSGFIIALALLVRSYRISSRNEHAARRFARSGRQSWFFTIAGALALWFWGSSMYLRFHSMAFAPDHLELIYFWPEPRASIPVGDLVHVTMVAAYRTCGHLEIRSRQALYRSVNFRNCKIADRVNSELVAQYGTSLKQ